MKRALNWLAFWWLNHQLTATAAPAVEEQTADEILDDWTTNAIRGEFAKRRLREQFPELGDPDEWVAAQCDVIQTLLDQDRFEKSVLIDIALLPETGRR